MSIGYCSSASESLTPPRETKGWAGSALSAASAAMVSEAFSTCLSFAETSPASIAARARARLSNSPRSTSKRSMRLRGEGIVQPVGLRSFGVEPFGGEPDARLERGQIPPDISRPLTWQHERPAVEIERMNHHQIVVVAEIFNGQSVGIG